jgi:predicted transcriptional regulator
MKSVSHIFGGGAKVKIMRLFIFNPGINFTTGEVANRAKEKVSTARKEIRILTKAGLIKQLSKRHTLDTSYPYLRTIENFLLDASPLAGKEIIRKISRTGNVKLILISGVFFHERDSRVDMLIVGDRLKQAKLLSVISSIEAELGKELRYAAFETTDFQYRLSIYDKLIRDILDAQHEKILNKLGI